MKRSDRINSDDPLADLPEWLDKFKENLKETELHASAHSSLESDPEYPTKVATESRDNHWCAVVVQDLATQWIQSSPCKNEDFT